MIRATRRRHGWEGLRDGDRGGEALPPTVEYLYREYASVVRAILERRRVGGHAHWSGVPERQRAAGYAQEDLEVAGQMARVARSRYVCWFSQQAAEKVPKAALVPEGGDFPYSHDLRRLPCSAG